MSKLIKLECLLMDNNEIKFHGRSLGFITKEEIKKYVFEHQGETKNCYLSPGQNATLITGRAIFFFYP